MPPESPAQQALPDQLDSQVLLALTAKQDLLATQVQLAQELQVPQERQEPPVLTV